MKLHEIKELAGHSSIQVTRRYAHLSPDGVTFAEMSAKWSTTTT